MEARLSNRFINPGKHWFETFFKTCAYIALPLLLMIALTMLGSYITTGGINTDVDNANTLPQTLVGFSFPMLIGLGVVPLFIKMRSEKKTFRELGFTMANPKLTIGLCAVSIALLVFAVIYGWDDPTISGLMSIIVVHFLFVGISEETILRSVIYDETGKIFKGVLNCVVTGLIFACAYHSGDDFVGNLMVRFPLGLLLGLLRYKSKSIYPAIAFHWAYDVFVSLVPF